MRSTLWMPSRYRHFKHPMGLVMRMLASRNADALSALARAGLECLAAPLDILSQPYERRLVRKASQPHLPIVQIVGPPRSGTTLAYQVLSYCLPFAYFHNLSALFPRSTITAARLFGVQSARSDGLTHSYYGHTSGLYGTNDGFHVWDRWLGDDRGKVAENLSESAIEDMRRFFNAWFESLPFPLLTKHNRNMLCMDWLSLALPTSMFVVVRRDPVFTAQSILVARERIQGDRKLAWGHGADLAGNSGVDGDPVVDVANQVRALFEVIEDQLSKVSPHRVLRVQYEEFCAEPKRYAVALQHLVQAHWPPAAEHGFTARNASRLDSGNKVRIAAADFERLEELLADLREEFIASRG